MCDWNTAVFSICLEYCLHTIKLTVLLFAFEKVKHPLYQIVDVKNFEFGGAVIYRELLIIVFLGLSWISIS